MDIRQPEFAALVFKRQLLVIDSQKMQHGGVEIMHMNRFFRDAISKIIAPTVGSPRLRSTSSKPHRKSILMMIAPRPGPFAITALHLLHWGAAKFPAPDHES